jgi:small-conductance mechanosensitive channel
VFEATLFLLVAHAYDVGDMLDIEGTLYRVMKITLLYTVSFVLRVSNLTLSGFLGLLVGV